MKSNRRLYYFTNNYPYGFGESWKTNELNELVRYFEKIDLIPFAYPNSGNKNAVNPIEGVHYHLPILSDGVSEKPILSKFFDVIFSPNSFYFIKEFLRNKLFLSKKKTIRWICASHKALQLKNSPELIKLIQNAPQDSIFYFFWGRETVEVLPLINFSKRIKKVVKFHGYDLYREVNDGYLPYQDRIMDSIDIGLNCSQAGLNTLCGYYPHYINKLFLQRIGIAAGPVSTASNDGTFRILTCSRVIKLKRLHLIPQILKCLDIKIIWTHIGDGPDFNEVIKIAENIEKSNIAIRFMGQMTANQVAEYYANHSVDLFLNVSESEGVPVSIMEALAANIPVMATNVGGTAELIDDKVGFLIDKNFEPEFVSNIILDFINKTDAEKNIYRANAFSRYKEMCKVENLTENLTKLLIN